MTIKLSKNNTPIYDYLSEGSGSNPAQVTATLTGSGGTLDSTTQPLYLVATIYRYTGITLTIINEQAGIDWRLSLDGSAWSDTINPADLNALSADQTLPIYAKAIAINDGTGNQPGTGIYTVPDIRITATEQPS